MPIDLLDTAEQEVPEDDAARHVLNFDSSIVQEYCASKAGKGTFRGEWKHDKSVSSAYWDPRGRQIVSTSYDDTLRCALVCFYRTTEIDFVNSMGHSLACFQDQ